MKLGVQWWTTQDDTRTGQCNAGQRLYERLPGRELMKLIIGTGADCFHEADFEVEKDDAAAAATLRLTNSVEAQAPAWLCFGEHSLFAVSEVDGQPGKLTRFQRVEDQWKSLWKVDSSSEGTCHCSIAHVGDAVLVLSANYVGHTVDVHDDQGELLQSIRFEGSGPFKGRQESSHCHQIIQDPQGKHVYVNDLGGDVLHQYSLSREHGLTETTPIPFGPGQGPRHTAFNLHHPELIYTICELSNEIVIHNITEAEPKVIQRVSILPDPSRKGEKHDKYPQPASAGEIQITKDGKFVYASTRYLPSYESDTIMWAALDNKGHIKQEVAHFDTGLIAPWHFSLSSDERFLAVAFKDSNVVKVLARNGVDGAIQERAALNIESPSCVLFSS